MNALAELDCEIAEMEHLLSMSRECGFAALRSISNGSCAGSAVLVFSLAPPQAHASGLNRRRIAPLNPWTSLWINPVPDARTHRDF